MVEARGQAERYAKALPIDHSWPPFLLVTDVGHCIDVYADFSGTGKQYTQFPDAARFRIALTDLRDEIVRTRLATIWTDPLSLDSSKESARVTREIAGHLAELSKRLEKREADPTRVADFLMRCLFTMFAEDVDLIPEGSFTDFLTRMQKRPKNFATNLSSLWQAMDKGGLAGVLGEASETVLRFNGYLFKDTTAIALNAAEIGLLIEAAKHKWNHVEPAIFGTLLERALDDSYYLGILSSRINVCWSLAAGGELGPTPRYSKSRCFDPFPFPADAPVAAPANVLPWPKTLAEQVSAVASVFAAAPAPQHPATSPTPSPANAQAPSRRCSTHWPRLGKRANWPTDAMRHDRAA